MSLADLAKLRENGGGVKNKPSLKEIYAKGKKLKKEGKTDSPALSLSDLLKKETPGGNANINKQSIIPLKVSTSFLCQKHTNCFH